MERKLLLCNLAAFRLDEVYFVWRLDRADVDAFRRHLVNEMNAVIWTNGNERRRVRCVL